MDDKANILNEILSLIEVQAASLQSWQSLEVDMRCPERSDRLLELLENSVSTASDRGCECDVRQILHFGSWADVPIWGVKAILAN